MMNIGQAAAATGVSVKMIRHYESVGLLREARRTDAGYRQYDEADLQTLKFIRHSRDLGFPIPVIARLVGLWQDAARPSREVKAIAREHIRELDEKAREILAMKMALERLVRGCHGDERPRCPIIESLADDSVPVPAAARRRPEAPAARGRVTGAQAGRRRAAAR